MKTRLDYLNQSQDQMDSAKQSHQNQKDKLQAQADLLETQLRRSEAEQLLEEMLSRDTLSLPDIISQEDVIAGYVAGEKALKRWISQLFAKA